ncbi:MAG: hypothetical protein HKM28_00630 [Flavobacteriaceae bacterium]|nr:hypothetical protein [Flavobacteriaceae bacterium]
MNKKYTTFEEIDQDLRRLYLQSEIDKEELKLSLHQSKESITPGKIVTGILGSVATSAVLVRLLTPVASFAISKYLAKKK